MAKASSQTTMSDRFNLPSNKAPAEGYASAVKEIEQEKQMVAKLKRLSIGHLLNTDPDVPFPDDLRDFEYPEVDSGLDNTLLSAPEPASDSLDDTDPPGSPDSAGNRSASTDERDTSALDIPIDAAHLWVPANAHPEINPLQFKSHVQNTIDQLLERKLLRSKSSRSKRSSLLLLTTDFSLDELHDSPKPPKNPQPRPALDAANPSLRVLTLELEELLRLAGMSASDAVTLARSLSTSSLGYTDAEMQAFDDMGRASRAEILDLGAEDHARTPATAARRPDRPDRPSARSLSDPHSSHSDDFALRRSRRLDYRKPHAALGSQLQTRKAENLAELRSNLSHTPASSSRNSLNSINPRSSQILFSYRGPPKSAPPLTSLPRRPLPAGRRGQNKPSSKRQSDAPSKYGPQIVTQHLTNPHRTLLREFNDKRRVSPISTHSSDDLISLSDRLFQGRVSPKLQSHPFVEDRDTINYSHRDHARDPQRDHARDPQRDHARDPQRNNHRDPNREKHRDPNREKHRDPNREKHRDPHRDPPRDLQRDQRETRREKPRDHHRDFPRDVLRDSAGRRDTHLHSNENARSRHRHDPRQGHASASQDPPEIKIAKLHPAHVVPNQRQDQARRKADKRDKTRELNQNLDLLRTEINEFKESLFKADVSENVPKVAQTPEPKDQQHPEKSPASHEDFSFDLSSHDVSYEDSLGIEKEILQELHVEKSRGARTSPEGTSTPVSLPLTSPIGLQSPPENVAPESSSPETSVSKAHVAKETADFSMINSESEIHNKSLNSFHTTADASFVDAASVFVDASSSVDSPVVLDGHDRADPSESWNSTAEKDTSVFVDTQTSNSAAPTASTRAPLSDTRNKTVNAPSEANVIKLGDETKKSSKTTSDDREPILTSQRPSASHEVEVDLEQNTPPSKPKGESGKLRKKKSFGALTKHESTERLDKKKHTKKTWLWSKERSTSSSGSQKSKSEPGPMISTRAISSPELLLGKKHKNDQGGKENVILKLFKKKRSNSVSSDRAHETAVIRERASSVSTDEVESDGKSSSSTRRKISNKSKKSHEVDDLAPAHKNTAPASPKVDKKEPEEKADSKTGDDKIKSILKGTFKKKSQDNRQETLNSGDTPDRKSAEIENKEDALSTEEEPSKPQTTQEVQEKLKKSIKRTSRPNQPIEFTDSAFGFPLPPPSQSTLVMIDHRFPVHVERAIYRLSHLKLANPKRSLREQVLLSNFMYAYLNLVDHTLHLEQQLSLEERPLEQPEAEMELFNNDDQDTEFEIDDDLDEGTFDTIKLDLDAQENRISV